MKQAFSFLFIMVITVMLTFAATLVSPNSALAKTFKKALPGYVFSFPHDHASHDDFKTEWWYFTGHLKTDAGASYGYELTFFRSGMDSSPAESTSRWDLQNVYMAHLALTDPQGHKFYFREKLNRNAPGVAGARQDSCYVYNELWSLEELGDKFVLRADVPEFGIHLLLSSKKKPTIHGANGVSQKASCVGCASHYYSMTRLETTGTLFLDKKSVPVSGLSWMDHEFGSNQLTTDQVGWDWFSVQLENGYELMLYSMRRNDGSIDKNSSGTLVAPDGSSRHLTVTDFSIKANSEWKSTKSGGTYPMDWQVTIPSANLNLKILPTMREQELVTAGSTGVVYWEGDSTVSGTKDGKPVTGQAYVEMTGYAEKFRKSI